MSNRPEESSDSRDQTQTAFNNTNIGGSLTIFGSITQTIKNTILTDRQGDNLNARQKLLKGVQDDVKGSISYLLRLIFKILSFIQNFSRYHKPDLGCTTFTSTVPIAY